MMFPNNNFNNSQFSKKSFFNDENLDNIKMISYCPFCEHKFNPTGAKVLEEKGDAYLVYITCQKCQSAIIALVFVGMAGISAVNVITDLSEEEVVNFKNNRKVTQDDVLNLFSILENKEEEAKLIKELIK